MMHTRRIGSWAWVLLLFASAAGCSGGDADGASANGAAGLGDGEVRDTNGGAFSAGAPTARESAGPAPAAPDVAYADAPAGSGASADAPVAGEGAGGPAPVDSPPSADPSGSAIEPVGPGVPVPAIEAGTLTAGVWDDNQNFDRFLRYREDLLQQNVSGALDFSAADHEAAHAAFEQRAPHTTLDVSLLIDTTGSMGDEIAYLQAEFLSISAAIESKFPNAEQRWSLVLYKDEGQGDEYVTRWFDFRGDAQEFRARLAEQSASGGGDFPEAPDAAFEIMNQLAWRTDPGTARLAFWVADAPHHTENAAALKAGIAAAAAQDIHVYPVASSGIDDLTELTMRSAAQLTGGRYLFLTDDSGVGDAHAEPKIPCYFVTKLDTAILRMVDVEMSGAYREPSAQEIVRVSGDPQDGACTLASGQQALAF